MTGRSARKSKGGAAADANGGMIANDLQYRVTRTAAREFEKGLARLDETEAQRSPEMRALMRAAMESQLEDLRQQLAAYEDLRAGRVQVLPLDSLEGLPDALIRARIAAGLTHKELARRLGVRESQVQRYESTRYAGASLARLQAVADALGVRTQGRVVLPASGGR
jgi:ribosome-binding protein aMBF1 (putative translation factor)